MPVIGITNCRKLEDYRQSILHVGGEVRELSLSMTVADALQGIGGLLLSGGEDVAPALPRHVVERDLPVNLSVVVRARCARQTGARQESGEPSAHLCFSRKARPAIGPQRTRSAGRKIADDIAGRNVERTHGGKKDVGVVLTDAAAFG